MCALCEPSARAVGVGRARGRAGRAPAGHAPVSVPEFLGPGARPGRERPERAKSGEVVIGSIMFTVYYTLDTSETQKYRDIGRLEPNNVRLEF